MSAKDKKLYSHFQGAHQISCDTIVFNLILIAFHNHSALVIMVLESMIFRINQIKKGERKTSYQKNVSTEIFFTWLDAIILLV